MSLSLWLSACSLERAESNSDISDPVEIEGLSVSSVYVPEYASGFNVTYYDGGYRYLKTTEGNDYLVIPEGLEVPGDLPEGTTVISSTPDHIYMAASAIMSLIAAMDAMSDISFSALDIDGWHIPDAIDAMESGDLKYAGKYSNPDYELLLDGDCDLAVESTMILHTPEVAEKLETVGIPVLIDYSSYEDDPLGRSEWIVFYGALLDRNDEAQKFFASQKAILEEIGEAEPTGQTIAFFFVNAAGQIVVRRGDDYIPRMIKMGGGSYIYEDLQTTNTDSHSGSVTLTAEQFYADAINADILIYNGTIDSALSSVDELIDKNEMFAQFDAVKNGRVYTTNKDLYQSTDRMAEMIRDIHTLLTSEDPAKETYSFLVHVR